MITQPKRLGQFSEYIFSRLGREMAAVEKTTGRKVLNFGAGNPDVRPSSAYLEKFKECIDDSDSHLYPGYRGIPAFNDAIIAWYKKRFGVELESSEVLPLLGGKEGISHMPFALLDPGDEVLRPDPGYPSYIDPNVLADAISIPYTLSPDKGFKITAEELESVITPKTRLMWVNFPGNPTGAVATVEDLTPIVDLARKHNIAILYDNAYAEITYDGFVAPSILQVPGAKEIAVEISSFSKMCSFAGFRMGWTVGNQTIIEALAKVKTQMDSGMSLPLQRLGAYALTNPDATWNAQMIESYRIRRDVIAGKLKNLGLTFDMPKGSLYLWARIPDSAPDAETFCMNLLKEKQVLFTPGTAFGKNGARYVRVSICINIEKIDEYL